MFNQLADLIVAGGEISYEQAMSLDNVDAGGIYELFVAACRVTREFHGAGVDLCSIMNVKSGRCSEDCAFCAQSGHYQTGVPEYPLLSTAEILQRALDMESAGARRFSLVASGRGIGEADFGRILDIFRMLGENTTLGLCASLGIINYDKACRLKEAGVTMYHHNLETSAGYYPSICTTHTFDQRMITIRVAAEAGLGVCAGGIIGLGEGWEHRVEMAFQLRGLPVASVPINILTPIRGTPLWGRPVPAPLEVLKTAAMFRLALPKTVIRLAGGREAALRDLQSMAFMAGVNGLMVGNYLTTGGRNIGDDIQMLRDLELY